LMWRGRGRDDGGNPLAALVVMILAPIAATLIQLAVSRSREYGADESGARLVGYPDGLARALAKLKNASERIPMHNVEPATAHLFIVNPLSGQALGRLFSTHPPLEERIARLMAMKGQLG
jgi:heat shock protein HtpX